MSETATLHMLRRLQEHTRWQDQRIKDLTIERDEWREKAEALCHIATYAAEQGQRKGLTIISKG